MVRLSVRFRIWWLLFAAASLADLVTGWVALAHGARLLNPLPLGLVAAVKVGIFGYLVLFYRLDARIGEVLARIAAVGMWLLLLTNAISTLQFLLTARG